MRITTWIARATLLAALMIVTSACGGGGGTSAGAFGPSLVEGTYRYWMMLKTGTNDVRVQTGRLAVDGQTLVASDAYGVQEGSVDGPSNGQTFLFDVEPDRTFVFVDQGLRGRITLDGMLATAISTTPETDSIWFTMMRQQETPLLSDLAGSWKSMQLGRTSAPGYFTASTVSDVEIDAFGNVTVSDTTANLDGDIDPFAGVPLPANLAILAGGTLALQEAGTLVQRGAVSEDGTLILLAGNLGTGNPGVRVLVRLDQATASDLAGTYGYTATNLLLLTPGSRFGTVTAHPGTSAMDLEASSLFAGSVSEPYEVALSRGVNPDGTLTVVYDLGGAIFRGAVGPAGSYAWYGGGITPSSSTLLAVLIR